MTNTSVDSSIPSGISAYDESIALPGDWVALSSPDGDAILGDAGEALYGDAIFCPEESIATAAPSGDALPGDAITPAAEDNTSNGPPSINGIVPLIPSWKTYIWIWLFLIGQILFPIFVALVFHLSQSDNSIIFYIDMLFIFILVHVLTFFLYFTLAHFIQYLKNKFPNPIVDSIVNVTVVVIYYTIIIVFNELGKPDLNLYVHFVVAICSSTFMTLLTYIFDEDVGKTRTTITLQSLAYILYYFQRHEKIYGLFYSVPSAIGFLTLIIGGDGPVGGVNEAFLRIISLTRSVRTNMNHFWSGLKEIREPPVPEDNFLADENV